MENEHQLHKSDFTPSHNNGVKCVISSQRRKTPQLTVGQCQVMSHTDSVWLHGVMLTVVEAAHVVAHEVANAVFGHDEVVPTL